MTVETEFWYPNKPKKKEPPSHLLWRLRPENKKKIKAYAKKWYAANKDKVKLKWMTKKD